MFLCNPQLQYTLFKLNIKRNPSSSVILQIMCQCIFNSSKINVCLCVWCVRARVRTCIYVSDESGEYLISSLDYKEENVIIKETIVKMVERYLKEVSVQHCDSDTFCGTEAMVATGVVCGVLRSFGDMVVSSSKSITAFPSHLNTATSRSLKASNNP